MNIAISIQHKLGLGQIPDDEFFDSFAHQHNLSADEKLIMTTRWGDLISFKFILLDPEKPLLEIQGHKPSFIDTHYFDHKQSLCTDVQALEWQNLLNYLCLKMQISWNTSTPFASFSSTIYERPCRITLIHQSLTCPKTETAKFFIRFHQLHTLSLEYFIQTKDQANLTKLLSQMVKVEKKNILICGSTGSGKTTLLKSLAQYIPQNDHVITLEDTEELFIQRERITSLQSGQINTNNQAEENDQSTSMNQLCSYTMRLTPDRLILGEIRGKEILTLAMMLNTGHQGLLTTVHASSAINAIQRLAILFCLYQQDGSSFSYQSTLKFLAEQFHRVIFIEDKVIKEVIQIIGADASNVFYDTLYQKIDTK